MRESTTYENGYISRTRSCQLHTSVPHAQLHRELWDRELVPVLLVVRRGPTDDVTMGRRNRAEQRAVSHRSSVLDLVEANLQPPHKSTHPNSNLSNYSLE